MHYILDYLLYDILYNNAIAILVAFVTKQKVLFPKTFALWNLLLKNLGQGK